MSTEETWFPKGPKGGTKFTFGQLSHSIWKVTSKINEHVVQKEDISSGLPTPAQSIYAANPMVQKRVALSSASINKFQL
jgi:hypothetical protein